MPEFIMDNRIELPKNIAIYITDQNHPSQRDKLPDNAIPGFVVQVWRLKGHKPVKCLESFYSRWKDQVERMAQEYARQYCTMAACGWR